MVFLKIYGASVILALLVHFVVGLAIKGKLHKLGIYDEFLEFDKESKSCKGFIQIYIKYLVFFIPVMGLAVAFVELGNIKKVVGDIIQIVDKRRRRG